MVNIANMLACKVAICDVAPLQQARLTVTNTHLATHVCSFSSPWKTYLNSKFSDDVSLIASLNLNCNEYPLFKDKCYEDMFATWADLHLIEPDNAE